MKKKKLSYEDFKKRRVEYQNNLPCYLQNLESCFETSTKKMYKNYIEKNRVPIWAKD